MGYNELSAKIVKARKQHSCEWCGQKVLIGEKCFYRAYKFDGDFQSGHMHLECKVAMEKTPVDELMDGWSFGSNQRGDPAHESR